MTKRELTKQARHVLGPGATTSVVRYGRLDWQASAFTATYRVSAGGINRVRAVQRLNLMLAHLDTSGWSWSRA